MKYSYYGKSNFRTKLFFLPALMFLPSMILPSTGSPSAHAWQSARVSHHPYGGYTLAARGMRMGTVILFKVGKRTHRGTVVDACGAKMKKWNRKFDLSTALFNHLFDGTGKGVGKVRFKIVRQGRGRMIPNYR